jgi:hypothetical protein
MAGTIVADTLQDGAGNSTAMDNAIYGTAKAWVNFNGVTGGIRASYNVSSITVNTTGDFTANFTTAMVDANYAVTGTAGRASGQTNMGTVCPTIFTTSSVRFGTDYVNGTGLNFENTSVAIFR